MPLLDIKIDYLREYAERRIVYDDVVLFVSLALIVTARIKRSHEIHALYSVAIPDERCDNFVNVVRRVAVVCCFRLLELVEELVVFVVSFLAFPVEPFAILEPVQVLLGNVESRHFYAKSFRVKLCDFIPNDNHIPLAQLTKSIVCENIRSALFVAQSLDKNTGNRADSEFLCRHNASVTGYKVIFAVNQTRSQESKLRNRRFEFFNLPRAVFLCVSLIRSE